MSGELRNVSADISFPRLTFGESRKHCFVRMDGEMPEDLKNYSRYTVHFVESAVQLKLNIYSLSFH